MRIILGAAGALLLAACGELIETGEVATGLVARTLCTATFVQGRAEADVRSVELGPLLDSRLAAASARIDRERGEVSADMFGLFAATAGHSPGLGCAVGRPGEGAGAPAAVAFDPRPFPEGDAAAAQAPDGVDMAALQAAVDAAFAASPGPLDPNTRSVVVVHRGELLLERHAPGWDGRTPQYSASMSKTVAAALVGVLVGRGALDLDATGLDPAWTDARASISMRHLLHMESGLGFDESYGGPADPGRMLYVEASTAAFAAAKPPVAPPGARFYYSSGDTNLLMREAREAFLAAGGDQDGWRRFPRAALFDPIGMRSALFEQDAAGDFVGSTFVFASALDWARFGLLLARDGVWGDARVLPEGWVATMSTPTEASGGQYGAQLWLRGGVPGAGPAPVLELSGFAGQMVAVHPPTQTVLVRMGWNPDLAAFDRTAFLADMFAALGIDAPVERAQSS